MMRACAMLFVVILIVLFFTPYFVFLGTSTAA
jgi:hypothetical protein